MERGLLHLGCLIHWPTLRLPPLVHILTQPLSDCQGQLIGVSNLHVDPVEEEYLCTLQLIPQTSQDAPQVPGPPTISPTSIATNVHPTMATSTVRALPLCHHHSQHPWHQPQCLL